MNAAKLFNPFTVAVLGLLLLESSQTSHAQLLWTQTTVASGLPGPIGVAVDVNGNVYITDSVENQVLKETPSGTSYTQSVVANYSSITVATGVISPMGVTVDASGNVFSTYTTTNYNYPGGVFKQTPTVGGGYSQTIAAGGPYWGPLGVAIDPSNNLFIISVGGTLDVGSPADQSGCGYAGGGLPYSAICVFEETYWRSLGTNPPTYRPGPMIQFGFKNNFGPAGIATDKNGYVYFTDSISGTVIRVSPPSQSNPPQTVVARIGGGFLWGIAVDGSGNVYVADDASNVVYKETVGTSGYTQTVLFNYVSSGLSKPKGIAVSADGSTIYIVDAGNGRVLKESPTRIRP